MKTFLPIAVALTPVSAWAADAPAEPYNWGPHNMMWGWGWSGMIFGPVFMILMLVVVIVVAVSIVRLLGGSWHGAWQGTVPPHYPPPGRTPLDILKERFARGEIDKAEFDERRRVLGD